MNWKRNRNVWLLASAIGLAISGGAYASGSTPTLQDALEASPNRLTAQEQAELERNAASGASALQAPEGVYIPDAASNDGTSMNTTAAPPSESTTGAPLVTEPDAASISGQATAAPSSEGTFGAPLVTEPDGASTSGQAEERSAVPAEPALPAVPAMPADHGVTPATPAEPALPAIPADQAESRDDAGARNDIAPRVRELPADRNRG